MRQVLIDHSRRKRAHKRGGRRQRVALSPELAASAAGEDMDLVDLDEALTRLGELDARKCRVVELRFFGGLSNEETAEVLGVSRKTVVEDWTIARLWLKRELGGTGSE